MNTPQIPPVPAGPASEAAPTGGSTKLSRRSTNAGKHHQNLAASSSSVSIQQAQPATNYVGTAKVLFDFPGSNPGELTVREGDMVSIIELDDGNGWMTVSLLL